MLQKNKYRLIAIIILIIIALTYVIVKDATAATAVVVGITEITFISPQTLEFTISGQMPVDVTNKTLIVTDFTISTSTINTSTETDATNASGQALITAAFIGQTPPLSINSTTNYVIATLTIPKYFIAQNIMSATINGTGTITIT